MACRVQIPISVVPLQMWRLSERFETPDPVIPSLEAATGLSHAFLRECDLVLFGRDIVRNEKNPHVSVRVLGFSRFSKSRYQSLNAPSKSMFDGWKSTL